MTEYQVQTTHIPPVLRLIDGALYVEVIFGSETYRAPIGDGRYFFSEVIAKLVDPALLAAYPARQVYPLGRVAKLDGSAVTAEEAERVQAGHDADLARAFASPND